MDQTFAKMVKAAELQSQIQTSKTAVEVGFVCIIHLFAFYFLYTILQ